jgi:Flp pilus assembly protein TadG
MRGQRGQALVELALTAPLLMLLALVAFSLTLAGQKKVLVTHAAAAAARVTVVRPDLAADEALAVLTDADPTIRRSDVKTTVERVRVPGLPASNTARVTVTLDYRPLTGFGLSPVHNLGSSVVVDRWSNAVWLDIPAPSTRGSE